MCFNQTVLPFWAHASSDHTYERLLLDCRSIHKQKWLLVVIVYVNVRYMALNITTRWKCHFTCNCCILTRQRSGAKWLFPETFGEYKFFSFFIFLIFPLSSLSFLYLSYLLLMSPPYIPIILMLNEKSTLYSSELSTFPNILKSTGEPISHSD